MNKILRDLLILLAVFGGIWAAIAYLPFKWNMPDFTISKEQEQRLGDILAEKMILDQWENISNQYPKVDSALRAIETRLLNNVDDKQYDYRFYILRDSSINAFTIAGGHIFIFEGLIKFSQTPEELAAIIAHEIGHAEKKHIAKKLSKDLGIELITTILGGGNDNMVKEAGKLLLSKRFDRSYEREADRFATELLEKSNISPYKMVDFFHRLDKKGYSYNKELELVMTHPHNDSRIKDILNYQTKATFKEKPFTLDWEAIKASLNEVD
jgi:predicted Zn-dependent protease